MPEGFWIYSLLLGVVSEHVCEDGWLGREGSRLEAGLEKVAS